jgi:hypothetical protein
LINKLAATFVAGAKRYPSNSELLFVISLVFGISLVYVVTLKINHSIAVGLENHIMINFQKSVENFTSVK